MAVRYISRRRWLRRPAAALEVAFQASVVQLMTSGEGNEADAYAPGPAMTVRRFVRRRRRAERVHRLRRAHGRMPLVGFGCLGSSRWMSESTRGRLRLVSEGDSSSGRQRQLLLTCFVGQDTSCLTQSHVGVCYGWGVKFCRRLQSC